MSTQSTVSWPLSAPVDLSAAVDLTRGPVDVVISPVDPGCAHTWRVVSPEAVARAMLPTAHTGLEVAGRVWCTGCQGEVWSLVYRDDSDPCDGPVRAGRQS